MKKKVISFVLIIAMLAMFVPSGLVGTTVFADDGLFDIEDGVLTYYRGNFGDVVIPNSVTSIGDGAFRSCRYLTSITIPNSVTSIGDRAFEECSSLTSITIPNSVTSIGNMAFYYCSSLTSITIPNSVTSIGDRAFEECSSLTSINVADNNQKFSSVNGILCSKDKKTLIYYPEGKSGSITIPNSVTSIGDGAFERHSNLTSITIPNSVTSIGNMAFYYCSSLTSITIPNSVTSIGDRAFEECRSLTSITIPSSVTSIGESAFYSCESLERITIPNSVTYIGDQAFFQCASLESITIPNGITTIYSGTFSWCESLESVIIPDSVTNIDGYAFCGCKSLKSITIPNSVTLIGGCAFYWCESLERITIPNSVTSIGDAAFVGCKSLTSITIPSSVTSIGDGMSIYGAFEYCSSLTSINVSDNNQKFSSMNGIIYDKDKKKLIFCPNGKSGNITIPNSVSIIERHAFSSNSLESIFIPKSVKQIGLDSFTSGYYSFDQYYLYPSSIQDFYYEGTETEWNSIETFGNSYGLEDDSFRDYLYNSNIHLNYKFTISSQPMSTSVKVNDSVTFSIEAQGEGLTYQWYYKKAGQTAWNKWGARTTATTTATANATWNGMQVYCKVTDKFGNSVDSNPATITIKQDLKITTQPTDKTVSKWNGRTHASETVTPNASWDGIQLYCTVKDSSGNSLDSSVAKITVTQDLKITAQPTNKTIKKGDSVTLSLKAEGNGLTYQWYYKKAGAASFSKWNGRTHATETATPNTTWNGIQLYCIVKDSAGKSVQSNTVKVNFSDVVTIVSQPSDVTIKTGDNVTFKFVAEGVGLTYQWYYKKAGATAWSKWGARTTASTTATSNASWDGMQVYCVVKDSSGNSLNSNTAKITLSDVLAITQQPTNVTTQAGKNVTFTVKAKGAGLTYQWYYKKAGTSDWSKWGARTTASTTATANATWNGMQVRCVVKDSTGKTVTSSAATITIK